MVVALNKVDAVASHVRAEDVRRSIETLGYTVFVISGVTREGVDALMTAAADLLASTRPSVPWADLPTEAPAGPGPGRGEGNPA